MVVMAKPRREILGESCEIYYENQRVVVFWAERIRTIGGVWKKAPGAEWNGLVTIQKCLTVGLEIIREKKATRWITDSREMPVLPPEAQKWTNEVWWPQAVELGFRWLAVVMPESAISQMALTRSIMDSMRQEINYFGSTDEAIQWLCSKP